MEQSQQDHRPFDLVVMDVQMPVMDGLAAVRELRRRPYGRDLPVIGASAGVLTDEVQDALNAGMNDFVSKPFEVGSLLSVIRRCAIRHDQAA